MLPEEIKKENNLGTGKFVLLNIFTINIFFAYRISVMTDVIRSFSGERIASEAFKYVMFVCVAFYILFFGSNLSTGADDDSFAAFLLSLAFSGMAIYWAFQAKTKIELYCLKELGFPYKMNGFYTFLFSAFYINYCLNDIQNESIKHEYLKKS